MSSCPLRAMCAQVRERSTGGAPAPRAAALKWEETSTSEVAAKVKNKTKGGKRLLLNWTFRLPAAVSNHPFKFYQTGSQRSKCLGLHEVLACMFCSFRYAFPHITGLPVWFPSVALVYPAALLFPDLSDTVSHVSPPFSPSSVRNGKY